jgi:CDP-2,3-bis-(O-geranylgeranyl)-sn-glycerol synthase
MITELIKAFWFFGPAGLANIAPVIVKKIDFLNSPVDFGKKFKGKRIFGSHKTFRGFFFGIIASILGVYLQMLLDIRSINLIDYNNINIILLGFLLGFGALFGDLIESFIKRQLSISPGKPFWFFDQVDWVFGGIAFSLLYVRLGLRYYLFIIIMFAIIHPLVNLLGYFLGIKKNKF